MSIDTYTDTHLLTVEEFMETDQGNKESRIPQLGHDLANFIEGIRLVLEETPWEHVSRAELLQRIMVIEQCSSHAAAVCRQLMESDSPSQHQTARRAIVDIASVTEELSGVLEIFVGGRGKLEISSDGQMAAFHGDATELRQILLDLITNARDAIDPENGRIGIHCGCTDDPVEEGMIYSADMSGRVGERYVFVEIEDNGHGIPANVMTSFLERRVSTKSAGHGLGISSVLRIVHRFGGVVGVRSIQGKGTCVRCLFPRATFPEHETRKAPDAGTELPRLDRKIKILLIEDNHAVCRLATLQLQKASGLDCEIVTASSIGEGIDRFRRADPPVDVVITDMMLPDGLGSHGLRQIREIAPHQPVIVMSGLSHDELDSCFPDQRPNGFLLKPLHTKEIVALVKKVLSN